MPENSEDSLPRLPCCLSWALSSPWHAEPRVFIPPKLAKPGPAVQAQAQAQAACLGLRLCCDGLERGAGLVAGGGGVSVLDTAPRSAQPPAPWSPGSSEAGLPNCHWAPQPCQAPVVALYPPQRGVCLGPEGQPQVPEHWSRWLCCRGAWRCELPDCCARQPAQLLLVHFRKGVASP